jgi:hypothetical protein
VVRAPGNAPGLSRVSGERCDSLAQRA